MKKIIILLILGLFCVKSYSQVGIGTISPHASAILEIQSTDKGFLLPRLTTSERDSINAGVFTPGLMIFNLDINCVEIYNSSNWTNLCNISNVSIPSGNIPTNIDSFPLGTASLSTKTCFDIAEANDLEMGCGLLSTRVNTRSNFNEISTNTQTLTFESTSAVSNVRFYYQNDSTGLVLSLTPSSDYSGNNITTATATIVYNDNLSSDDPNSPSNGLAFERSSVNALKASFYVVYDENSSGGGNERKNKIQPQVKDCSCSGFTQNLGYANRIITSDGDLLVNGFYNFGTLGLPSLPVTSGTHSTLTELSLPDPIEIIGNSEYSSIAKTVNGDVYVWGYNSGGLLGTNNSTNYNVPTLITYPNNLKPIRFFPGRYYNLFLADDGEIYGMGASASGLLGLAGSASGVPVPTKLPMPVGVKGVLASCSNSNTTILGDDKKLYVAGAGVGSTRLEKTNTTGSDPISIGQTINNLYFIGHDFKVYESTFSTSSAFNEISIPNNVGNPVVLFASEHRVHIITSTGKLLGYTSSSSGNSNGQLGINTSTTTTSFVEAIGIPSNVAVVHVYTAFNTTIAVGDDGKLYSAGGIDYGLLLRNSSGNSPTFSECTDLLLTGKSFIGH